LREKKFISAKKFSIKCNSDILSGIEDGMFGLIDDQLDPASSS
jgi:hypothetical protein